jgi:hypothetical protein
MRVYALAVMKSDVHDVRRRKTLDRQMHLIAFVAYQYYNLQDNLVATLLSSVKAAENSAAREFKDWCFAERKSQAAKLKARIQAFEVHFQTAMATLQSVFDAADLSDTDKLTSLRLLLFPVDAMGRSLSPRPSGFWIRLSGRLSGVTQSFGLHSTRSCCSSTSVKP